ncbi:MAG: hypothetical protein E6J47_02530 [Chloroflexi bacterium]|nr:MAG: hypothetical protein E6J47_02530 [Chloroflexota bacterium]
MTDSIIGAAPEGMPDPNLTPPQIARVGDPFASVRVVHFLARVKRNTTHQLRDVVATLNATYLDWYFPEKMVLAELVQLQANWAISFHGEDRIVLDRNERGHTLLIVDSTKMTPFLVGQATRLRDEAEEELRRFSLGDGVTTDN